MQELQQGSRCNLYSHKTVHGQRVGSIHLADMRRHAYPIYQITIPCGLCLRLFLSSRILQPLCKDNKRTNPFSSQVSMFQDDVQLAARPLSSLDYVTVPFAHRGRILPARVRECVQVLVTITHHRRRSPRKILPSLVTYQKRHPWHVSATVPQKRK